MYLDGVCWKLFSPHNAGWGILGAGEEEHRGTCYQHDISCDADFDHEVEVVSARPLYCKVAIFLFILKLFSLFVRSQLRSRPHPKGVELVVWGAIDIIWNFSIQVCCFSSNAFIYATI